MPLLPRNSMGLRRKSVRGRSLWTGDGTENPETHSLDPSPDEVAEIDRRAALLRAEPDQPRPYAGELPQGPMLFAFTTGERAKTAALDVGLSDDEASTLLAIPLPSAIEWAASFAAVGVKGITFDLPAAGFFAPLDNLIPMRDYMASHPPAV